MHRAKNGDDFLLSQPAGVSDNPDGGKYRAGRQEYFPGHIELVGPPLAPRVVEGNHVIGGGGRRQASFDDVPGGKEVG